MLKTPPRQTATATIDTLSDRLQSATLLEDRRAAILGLRSFAKQYPASVASGSLRELIATLRRDGLGEKSSKDERGRRREEDGTGDVDTIRLVLETLLMLFNPDSESPEAGDEIAFFMADEFSVRQDNISLLLNLLDPTSPYADYYSRLYSLQLLSAICAARPERLQECILSAPLGISRLVGSLDDGRDAVRNAGLLLLVDLTSGANEDLRKIVAFEDVFGKAFALIRLEGGLAEAGITAQDCLSLLANLIAGSSSNQTMFRESGCVTQLAQLLQEVFPPSSPEAAYILQRREKSAFGLLQLLRFFFVPGESSTPQNQTAFFRAGTAQILIDIGFHPTLPPAIRTASLIVASELIASNSTLQESFAGLTIISPSDNEPSSPPAQQQQQTHLNGSRSAKTSARPSAERPRTYIIEALLTLTLTSLTSPPGLRNAAYTLINAYISGHEKIKSHFLSRAISGHAQQEGAANVLSALTQPVENDGEGLLFASWIVQDLISEDPEAKAALAAVREGDETEGEDVLSFIQTLASQLEAALSRGAEGDVAAYASLLVVFLWEFAEGVDDFLAEASSLLQLLASHSGTAVSQGLAAALLGTVYEFSTKDSPIPRRTLAPLLTQKLGRRRYLDALLEVRRHPAIRDFDLAESGSREEHLFGRTFVELFTLEFHRLRKAVDKDPGLEVLPPSAAEAGVDRDVLDELRSQLQTTKDALAQSHEQSLQASQKFEQEMLASGKEVQTAGAEVERLRRINQALQAGHEGELEKLSVENAREMDGMRAEHARALESGKEDTRLLVRTAVQESEGSFAERIQEYERRIAELGNTHRAEQSGHRETRQRLDSLSSRHEELSSREKGSGEQFTDLSQRHSKLEKEHQNLQASATQASTELERLKAAHDILQTERDATFVRIQDYQEELKAKNDELIAERAGFADLERELEAAKGAAGTSSSTADTDAMGRLESEVKAAKEGEKSAKEELESMLLVMGDIEAKRDAYREKVKGLGGEVSEDDDDDGEEDGEDKEEDEDVD